VIFTSVRRYCDPSCLFVCWFVGSLVCLLVCSLVLTRPPAAMGGGRECGRRVALRASGGGGAYERFFLVHSLFSHVATCKNRFVCLQCIYVKDGVGDWHIRV